MGGRAATRMEPASRFPRSTPRNHEEGNPMTNDETGERYPTGGVFLEVEPLERLVFTWGEPGTPVEAASVITLTFNEQGDRTELIFHLRGIDGKPGDNNVYDGWDEALTNFE